MPFISLSLLDTAVSKISRTFLVPKKLRHLPRVSIVKLLLSYARGEPDDIRAQRLLMPFSEKGHDLVLVWALGRWIVHVLNHEVCSTSEFEATVLQSKRTQKLTKTVLWLACIGSFYGH